MAERFTDEEKRIVDELKASPHLMLSFCFGNVDVLAEYRSMRASTNMSLLRRSHMGQRKLLLAEIEFIASHLSSVYDDALMLYPGAGPGDHIIILLEIFPNLKIIGYDPYGFTTELMRHDRFEVHKCLFTDEIAMSYAKKNVTFLVSDIRRRTSDKDKLENIIGEDMALQKRWVEMVRPEWAMLKTRFPWREDLNTDEYYDYLDGEVNLQQWAALFSSEGRIWVPRPPEGQPYPIKSYSLKSHDDQSFTYNVFLREYANYFKDARDVELLQRLRDVSSRFFEGADTAGEIRVWRKYLALEGAIVLMKLEEDDFPEVGMIRLFQNGLDGPKVLGHKKVSRGLQESFDRLWGKPGKRGKPGKPGKRGNPGRRGNQAKPRT